MSCAACICRVFRFVVYASYSLTICVQSNDLSLFYNVFLCPCIEKTIATRSCGDTTLVRWCIVARSDVRPRTQQHCLVYGNPTKPLAVWEIPSIPDVSWSWSTRNCVNHHNAGQICNCEKQSSHDDVINGNIFRVIGHLCWEFTGGRWRGALMFSLISAWINCWVNNRGASVWQFLGENWPWCKRALQVVHVYHCLLFILNLDEALPTEFLRVIPKPLRPTFASFIPLWNFMPISPEQF